MESVGTVVGFVGLDALSLEMASSLLCSGYKVQAFEVSLSLSLDHFKIPFSFLYFR